MKRAAAVSTRTVAARAGVVVPDLSNQMFGSFVATLERLARIDGVDASWSAAVTQGIRRWRASAPSDPGAQRA